MRTFTIFLNSTPWDECRAASEQEALIEARRRYPNSHTWVRKVPIVPTLINGVVHY